ncbi:MAG: hypothetical protein LBQ49_02115, partial [Rickettsiales bacterium]|nr:hypothetical protein [Rickettsiales bacterium]
MEKVYLVVDGSQAAPNIRHALLSEGIPRESIVEIEQSDPRLYDIISTDPGAKAVIVSGSPRSVTDAGASHLDRRVYDLRLKKLLICYAFQDAAFQLGGAVSPAKNRENGTEIFEVLAANPLINSTVRVISNHGDEVEKLWSGATVVARTKGNENAAAMDAVRNILAVQPHFEISQESVRREFFHNFRSWIGFEARKEFTAEVIAEYVDEDIRKKFPLEEGRRAMIALSGGVDSTTLAAALIKAYGRDKVDLVFVDTGLLRYDFNPKNKKNKFEREPDRLLKLMRDQFGEVINIDARKRFIDALSKADGFDNPETNKGRRQIIGNLFADIFADFARERGDIKYFFQGTNQADKQESGRGAGKSDQIKTHHNEVPYLREALNAANVEVGEPLDWLYKNNIVALGEYLGLNMDLYKQPPFPGPGMAVRIDGEVSEESLDTVCKADAVFRFHIENAMRKGEIPKPEEGFKTRQYFAALLNADETCAPSEYLIDQYAARGDHGKSLELYCLARGIVKEHAPKSAALPYCAVMNGVKTTGQKGDGRLGGYQVEMR